MERRAPKRRHFSGHRSHFEIDSRRHANNCVALHLSNAISRWIFCILSSFRGTPITNLLFGAAKPQFQEKWRCRHIPTGTGDNLTHEILFFQQQVVTAGVISRRTQAVLFPMSISNAAFARFKFGDWAFKPYAIDDCGNRSGRYADAELMRAAAQCLADLMPTIAADG